MHVCLGCNPAGASCGAVLRKPWQMGCAPIAPSASSILLVCVGLMSLALWLSLMQ
jgi:hypothetical protein